MESHGNAPITLSFTNGQHVQVSREFWTKNDLDRFDSVRAVKHGKLILFYGDFLSDEEKANLPQETKEEQTEFTVILKDFGTKKLEVVRAVRELTGLGLRESMVLVTEQGTLKKDISKEEAEMIKERMSVAGATVEIK
jgi:ribosomal protein L7/L12